MGYLGLGSLLAFNQKKAVSHHLNLISGVDEDLNIILDMMLDIY